MNDNPIRFTRRSVAIGGGVAVALGLGALGMSLPKWLRKSYPATPYDDLFELLPDRAAALHVGKHLQSFAYQWDVLDPRFSPKKMPDFLRQRLADKSLEQVTQEDLTNGRLFEADWIIPETLGYLCLLLSLAFDPPAKLGLRAYR